MVNNQINQSFQNMRSIINNLRLAEQNNVTLARQLAGQEANNANPVNPDGSSDFPTNLKYAVVSWKPACNYVGFI